MRVLLLFSVIGLLVIGTSYFNKSYGQFLTISGTVYDISAKRPLEAVAVQSTSGRGVITDSLGRYLIIVRKTDSIWFSMLGKATQKYPVDTILYPDKFDIMIHLRANDLPEVKVRNNYYKLDSIQNRKDYAKIFDFKKPTLSLSNNPNYNPGGLTVGFDLTEIINMFRTRRNNSILNLQKRLIEQEQEKYVNRRFSKQFVRKITKLNAAELDTFMARYRPAYSLITPLNDLELGYLIGQSFEHYKASNNRFRGSLRKEQE